ncbi:fungal specific transcription factor domain-containing protein [Colletotrichum incanum]|uniref:Fungal specific transcription factor domain-containing protein n=1 Tax=Colletotrichum incanum TaxID=1573173 RepID=A0A167B5Z3_COLIC|nr:fungal specific transcription factor domain-containing protein [Colletotrichum incanum]
MEDSQFDGSGHEDTPDEGHEEAPEASSANPQPIIRRARGLLTSFKIRCSRESPCSYCTHAKIECTHADNKPKEKRTRILITPQYERKIDQIDRRLETVIRLLQDMKVHPTSSTSRIDSSSSTLNVPQVEGATSSAQLHSSTSTPATSASHAHQSDEGDGAVVEGDSSLAAHSVFATEFVQKVVNTESLQDSSLDLGETLDALSQIVNALKQPAAAGEMTYPHAKPINRLRIQGLELPPIEKAVNTIRIAKGQRLTGMAWIYDFLPSRRFPDLCLNVYFSDTYSDYDFITVNGGLYSLFTDYAAQISVDERREYMEYAKICRENLETCLLNLPLHLPASSDVIVALLFGLTIIKTFHAVEISKPSLAWTLASKASELCQTLGYHRVESLKSSKNEGKPTVHGMHWHQFLFWNVYYIDKSLSLRLGRASTIPDWHITMPLPSLKDPISSPILPYLVLWIKTAKCQGQIYEKLYSPDSMTQPYHVRQTRVHELVSSLHDIEIRTQEISANYHTQAKDAIEENFAEFYLSSDSVLRLSLLTLVYRAAPRVEGSPTTFSPECIKAARAALEKHRECVAIMRKSHDVYFSTYIHWTVLFSPFIPFIVLFCQVIETQDKEDLARLHSFVVFLQETSTMSDAAGKMSRLFQVLYSVALRFVEFRASTPQSRQTQASAEMDAYLAALGFPPKGTVEERQQQQQPAAFNHNAGIASELLPAPGIVGMGVDAMDESLRPGNPMMWMTNAAQLEDFFYSNAAMMDLLQDPGFDPLQQS